MGLEAVEQEILRTPLRARDHVDAHADVAMVHVAEHPHVVGISVNPRFEFLLGQVMGVQRAVGVGAAEAGEDPGVELREIDGFGEGPLHQPMVRLHLLRPEGVALGVAESRLRDPAEDATALGDETLPRRTVGGTSPALAVRGNQLLLVQRHAPHVLADDVGGRDRLERAKSEHPDAAQHVGKVSRAHARRRGTWFAGRRARTTRGQAQQRAGLGDCGLGLDDRAVGGTPRPRRQRARSREPRRVRLVPTRGARPSGTRANARFT